MPNENEINRLVMMGAFVTGPRTKFLEKKMERIKSKKKVTKERACSDPNPPAMGHFSGSPNPIGSWHTCKHAIAVLSKGPKPKK